MNMTAMMLFLFTVFRFKKVGFIPLTEIQVVRPKRRYLVASFLKKSF